MGEKNNRPPEQEVTAYKGFDVNLQCRGFQFEVGETYLHEEEVQACESGFHACEYPLDVFKYYPPAKSRFARVTQSGQISRHGEDSKVASSVIRVDAEIGLPDLVQAAVAYTASLCAPCGALPEDGATGERGAASATGYRGAASATGYLGAASATGDLGAASATGERGAASATGERGAAWVSGKNSVACAFGTSGRAKAAAGGAVVLCHRSEDGAFVHIRACKVGENGIQPDTWYSLDAAGNFFEVQTQQPLKDA